MYITGQTAAMYAAELGAVMEAVFSVLKALWKLGAVLAASIPGQTAVGMLPQPLCNPQQYQIETVHSTPVTWPPK